MFLGFFAWYRGLALGGVAKIGQIQLAQPVLTLLWSALILGEQVTAAMVVAALAVLACVLATQRTRASAHDERGRRRALDAHRDLAQGAALPRRPQQREDDDVVHLVAVPVPRAAARPRAGTRSAPAPAVSARCACSPTRSAARSRAAGRPAPRSSPWPRSSRPSPTSGCPSQEPTVARRSRRASSRQPGHAERPGRRVDDQEVQQLARLALGRLRRDAASGCAELRVRPPREEARHRRDPAASSNSRGASSATA